MGHILLIYNLLNVFIRTHFEPYISLQLGTRFHLFRFMDHSFIVTKVSFSFHGSLACNT